MKINMKIKFMTKAMDPIAAFSVVNGTPSPTLVASDVQLLDLTINASKTVENVIPTYKWEELMDWVSYNHLKVVGPRIVSRAAFGQKVVEFWAQGEGDPCPLYC